MPQVQLLHLQELHDVDGNQLLDREEWRLLLEAGGSKANAEALFNKLDKDKSGMLDQEEIKELRNIKRNKELMRR